MEKMDWSAFAEEGLRLRAREKAIEANLSPDEFLIWLTAQEEIRAALTEWGEDR